jgi:hypothetical protein
MEVDSKGLCPVMALPTHSLVGPLVEEQSCLLVLAYGEDITDSAVMVGRSTEA